MILRVNGVVMDPGGSSVIDYINEFSDWLIGKEAELIIHPTATTLVEFIKPFIAQINLFSAEIITIGIVACAFGMMLAGSGKWLSRLFMVFWTGVIWRMLT